MSIREIGGGGASGASGSGVGSGTVKNGGV